MQKFSSENQRDIIDIDPMAMSLLTAWSWPGNIRELSNVIERAVVMNSGPIIFSEDLPPQIRQPVCSAGEAKTAPVGERNLKEEIKRVEKRIIMEVLEQQEGNRTRTALMLGISRRALMYKPVNTVSIRRMYNAKTCYAEICTVRKFLHSRSFNLLIPTLFILYYSIS